MGGTLMQRRRVSEEVFRYVKLYQQGIEKKVPEKEAPANYVPAAAVIRRGRALSGFTGCKGGADGSASQE